MNEDYESLNNAVIKTLYSRLAAANAQPINVSESVMHSRERELVSSLWESQETPKQVKKVL